jgi:CelD/BcsL family acetyltransferase involved in cellulose biosynthesis
MLRGVSAIREWLSEFEEWAEARSVPVTGSAGWILSLLNTCEPRGAWSLVARNYDDEIVGAIVLVDDVRPGGRITTLVGTDLGHRGFLPAESPDVAEQLGRAIESVLRPTPIPTFVSLGPLPAADPAVHALAMALPGAHVVPDDPIPLLLLNQDDINRCYSHGMRRNLRKAHNRLERDGRRTEMFFTTEHADIVAQLPVLERCHRERDHAHGRESDLDESVGRELWRARIDELSRCGMLELATMYIDGDFAAHTLGIIDGSIYRVMEGRFVTKWSRYAPGRLLEAAMIERVVSHYGIAMIDWMTSIAPETLIASNGAEPMVRIHWSNS